MISAVLRSTILQTSTSEEFRSRTSAVQIAAVTGGPRPGDLEAGAVAILVSTEFSIVSGGLADGAAGDAADTPGHADPDAA